MRTSKKFLTGFTLIEIMTAITVFSVGILGVFSLVPLAISISQTNSDHLIAGHLALEGMEILRNIRDSNWLEQAQEPLTVWNEGLAVCENGCEADYTALSNQDPLLVVYGSGRYLKLDSDGFYNYASGTVTKFKREITVNSLGSVLEAAVSVQWSPSSAPVVLKEKFYDWR